MQLSGKTVLVTGANRGIGAALVEVALNRGAERVFAATRQPFIHPDHRVISVILDVTDTDQIAAAGVAVGERLDILINNAGVGLYFDDITDGDALQEHLGVNLIGTANVTRAFLPAVTAARGVIVNILSIAALAALPIMPAYSASKAAAFSWSQSLRALLASKGVSVHAVLTGPVDTDMTKDLEIPKSSPISVAVGIFDGIARGDEEIFPEPMSQSLAESWNGGALRAMAKDNAAYV